MNKDDYIYCVKQNSDRIYRLALSFIKSHYDAEDDSMISTFENEYDCKLVISKEISHLYRYAIAKKINLFSQQGNASTVQK